MNRATDPPWWHWLILGPMIVGFWWLMLDAGPRAARRAWWREALADARRRRGR